MESKIIHVVFAGVNGKRALNTEVEMAGLPIRSFKNAVRLSILQVLLHATICILSYFQQTLTN